MANTIPIPLKMRAEIAKDPFMKVCIYQRVGAPNHNCYGRVEWEHSHTFAGRRINQPWAIVPCCKSHNRGDGIVKEYNQYIALVRATILLPNGLDDLMRDFPPTDWKQRFKYLHGKYGSHQV